MTERLANDAVIDRAITSIKALRVDGGEVFLRDGRSTSIEVRDGEVENAITRGERGIGVRVLRGGHVGFAYSSDLSPGGIEECVDSARNIAAVTEPDPDVSIATQKIESPDLRLYEPGIDARSVAERANVAFAIERAAKKVDPRITGFRKTTYSDGSMTTIVATTAEVRGTYRETYFSAGTSAVATAGDERQIGSHGEAGRRFAAVDADAVGRRSAELAIGKLGARPFKTQTLPIVLDPYLGMSLLGALVPLFSADSVIKGKSLFAGKVGEPVASERVTIIDDARTPGALRTAPFDGEGVATTTRTLVDAGVLRGYLSSLKTAKKMEQAPTGNARRGSYATPGPPPAPRGPPGRRRGAASGRRTSISRPARPRRMRWSRASTGHCGSPRSSTCTRSIRSPGSSRSARPVSTSSGASAHIPCRASRSPEIS